MGHLAYLKGHGTENDFVLLPDPEGVLDLTTPLVQALCHRRAGLGADGVLRVVRTAAYDHPSAVTARGEAEWFMDYRNADGSPSEMCGNGIRVFGRYLAEHQEVDVSRPLSVGTRGGTKVLTFHRDQVSVDLGLPQLLGETKVGVAERSWAATHVSTGNPHAVAFVDSLDDAGSLRDAPWHDDAVYPDGVNVEFVARLGGHHIAMRVHERGSGETRSCGTGACAAAVATAAAAGEGPGTSYTVDVPGGRLRVAWREDGHVTLSGPAVIVATGSWLG